MIYLQISCNKQLNVICGNYSIFSCNMSSSIGLHIENNEGRTQILVALLNLLTLSLNDQEQSKHVPEYQCNFVIDLRVFNDLICTNIK